MSDTIQPYSRIDRISIKYRVASSYLSFLVRQPVCLCLVCSIKFFLHSFTAFLYNVLSLIQGLPFFSLCGFRSCTKPVWECTADNVSRLFLWSQFCFSCASTEYTEGVNTKSSAREFETKEEFMPYWYQPNISLKLLAVSLDPRFVFPLQGAQWPWVNLGPKQIKYMDKWCRTCSLISVKVKYSQSSYFNCPSPVRNAARGVRPTQNPTMIGVTPAVNASNGHFWTVFPSLFLLN